MRKRDVAKIIVLVLAGIAGIVLTILCCIAVIESNMPVFYKVITTIALICGASSTSTTAVSRSRR